MMTMQLDMTAQLAAMLYGLVITLGVSFFGILAHVSRDEMKPFVERYRYYRAALRRRQIRMLPSLPRTSSAH